jgi:hypothetical protein
MTEEHSDSVRVNLYPPYVLSEEDRRRWRLATRAAFVSYGYQPGDDLDRLERTVIWMTQRSIYWSDIPSGDGDLTDAEAVWLRGLGLY